jgi:hypothetical protein
MSEIKVRCSSIHHIMTEPKVKSETLSEGCKTHLIDLFVAKKYGRHTEIKSKYTDKGNMVEEDSITLYSRIKKTFFKKNDERINNSFIEGTPDFYEGTSIYKAERVIDTKSSFDIYTFFRAKYKPLNMDYWWQLQGYMALTGAKVSTLAYCLIDTPNNILEDEKRRLFYSMGGNNSNEKDFLEACEKIDRLHRYDDIPMEDRLHETEILRDDAAIEKIYKKVVECRKYMKEKFNFPESLNIAA